MQNDEKNFEIAKGSHYFHVSLAPGVSLEEAQSEIDKLREKIDYYSGFPQVARERAKASQLADRLYAILNLTPPEELLQNAAFLEYYTKIGDIADLFAVDMETALALMEKEGYASNK